MGTRKLIAAGCMASIPPGIVRTKPCPILKQSRARRTLGPPFQWQARQGSDLSATTVVKAALAGLQGAMRRREATLPLSVDYGQVCSFQNLPGLTAVSCGFLTLRHTLAVPDADQIMIGLVGWEGSFSCKLGVVASFVRG